MLWVTARGEGAGPIRALSLSGPWEPPPIPELGSFGMEPGSPNQHRTDPSIGNGQRFWEAIPGSASVAPRLPGRGGPTEPLASSGPDETSERISEAG